MVKSLLKMLLSDVHGRVNLYPQFKEIIMSVRSLLLCIYLILLIFLCGCSPNLCTNQEIQNVAIIARGSFIDIVNVDGKKMSIPGLTNECRVCPGKHNVAVQYQRSQERYSRSVKSYSKVVVLPVEAKAGHAYVLTYQLFTDEDGRKRVNLFFKPMTFGGYIDHLHRRHAPVPGFLKSYSKK